MNSDEKLAPLLFKEAIKKEVEIPVEFEVCEEHECVVCISQNLGCFDISTTNTTVTGIPLLAFLSKFSKADRLSTSNSEKYICKKCLHLINDLEQAEMEYVKLKYSFELIISNNPLFQVPPSGLECVVNVDDIYACSSSGSKNETLLVPEKNGMDIKKEDFGEICSGFTTFIKMEPIEEGCDLGSGEISEESQVADVVSAQTSQVDERKQVEGSKIATKDSETKQDSTEKVFVHGPHQCNVCQRHFRQRSDMIRHFRTHTGERPYKCDVCQHRFIDSSSLITHSRVHTGEKPYQCDECDYRCSVRQSLYNHKRTHTGEKPYKCEICQKGFSQKNSLSCHLRTHTGEKPYECDVCQRRFNESSKLLIHSRIHTGEKPYKCDLCQYRCVEKKALVNHKRTHTGEKPFTCHICQRGFSQKHSLLYHIKTHTGDKPFKCDLCDYCCREKTHLLKHLRTHSGEKPHGCNVCQYRSHRKSNLLNHMKTHNSDKGLKERFPYKKVI